MWRVAVAAAVAAGLFAVPAATAARQAKAQSCVYVSVWVYEWGVRHDVTDPSWCVVTLPDPFVPWIDVGTDTNLGNSLPVTGAGFTTTAPSI